jgi:hypothetical protein
VGRCVNEHAGAEKILEVPPEPVICNLVNVVWDALSISGALHLDHKEVQGVRAASVENDIGALVAVEALGYVKIAVEPEEVFPQLIGKVEGKVRFAVQGFLRDEARQVRLGLEHVLERRGDDVGDQVSHDMVTGRGFMWG